MNDAGNDDINWGFRLVCSSPDGQEIYPTSLGPFSDGGNFGGLKDGQNRRKKRTRSIRIEDDSAGACSGGGGVSNNKKQPKSGKKPDPGAPKITRPCSECGKKFWSWKALFGHMRCHPERQWRGINPPPNFRPPVSSENSARMTEEDQEVAICLLMLANGLPPTPPPPLPPPGTCGSDETPPPTYQRQHYYRHQQQYHHNNAAVTASAATTCAAANEGRLLWAECDRAVPSNCTRFECSSCKKVFGSHQALGGHRASHKNIKGCFAITRTTTTNNIQIIGEDEDDGFAGEGDPFKDGCGLGLGHKCSICLRVFSSGQALGGHKRCHWENKGDDFEIDLNLPASSSSSFSSHLPLDLKLGL